MHSTHLKGIKIKRRWSATQESCDSPVPGPTSPDNSKWMPMSIVPTPAATLTPYHHLSHLTPTTNLGANNVYSNMAYMNSAASSAGLPFMLSQTSANSAGSAAGLGNSNSAVALLNVSNLLSQKDSRWLQLEVCREFQRNKCSRSDTECKFAHPAANVEVQNGRVTACYDSIKVSHVGFDGTEFGDEHCKTGSAVTLMPTRF